MPQKLWDAGSSRQPLGPGTLTWRLMPTLEARTRGAGQPPESAEQIRVSTGVEVQRGGLREARKARTEAVGPETSHTARHLSLSVSPTAT